MGTTSFPSLNIVNLNFVSQVFCANAVHIRVCLLYSIVDIVVLVAHYRCGNPFFLIGV